VNSRRSWVVFAVGTFAYLVAITQRNTIGVAGAAAADRFETSASVLSTLAVVQIVVYALMQVPVGVLIDRHGPRWLLMSGTGLMALGQILVGLAPGIEIAVLGRMLVGAGDATLITSVIRVLNSWFSPRRIPLLSQAVGTLGQLGQVISAVPFVIILNEAGWTVAFVSAAALSVLALIGVALGMASTPPDAGSHRTHATMRRTYLQLRAALRRPGVQLGFWTNYISHCSATAFTLMWGVPFMVFALGYTSELAASLLLIGVATALISGPILGALSTRFPRRRSDLVFGLAAALTATWAALLLWPGVPPLWLVALLLGIMGSGGPAAMTAFDVVRMFNPRHSLGSANGIVNGAGYLAGFAIMLLTGLLLDIQSISSGRDLYSLDAFRVAFVGQFVVMGIGVVFLLRSRHRAFQRLRETGEGSLPLG